MKKSMLLLVAACLYLAGYGQYIPGEPFVNADRIPSLLAQLKTPVSGQQRASLLLQCGYGYLYRDGEKKEDLDSALICARLSAGQGSPNNNSSQVQQSLLLMSMAYMEQKDFAAAEALHPAMNDTTRLKSLICLSIFNSNTAGGSLEDGAFLEMAAGYAREALKLAIKTRVQMRPAVSALEFMGIQYRRRHMTAMAEKYFLLTLECRDDTGYPSRARVYSNLSAIYTQEANFYKAMDYAIKAEKALNATSSVDDLAYVYNCLGSLNSVQNKPEKVLVYYGKMLAQPQRFQRHIRVYGVAASYYNNMQKLGRNDEVLPSLLALQQKLPPETDLDRSFCNLIMGRAYGAMKQFAISEKHYLEAIRYADAARIPTANLHSQLGVLYFQWGEYEKAVSSLKKAEKEIGAENNSSIANNLLFIARSEAALGHHESAYQYLLKSKTLSDSMFTVGRARLTDELETQYNTQKKEADLRLKEENIRVLNYNAEIMAQDARIRDAELKQASLISRQNEIAFQLKTKDVELLERNLKLQQAAADRANARRNIILLFMALMAVIVVLLCWLFWSKLKSNKVISNKNALLQQLVKDKSWLLKEMHHRVKNNLHIIVSLLESQSTYLQDDALQAIQHSQSRIFSMSLIHQKLYQTGDAKTIDMSAYVPELVDYLKESFSMHRSVRVNMDIDHTYFNVEEAVALGLIINEVVTNSMKYAFNEHQFGEISISLKTTSGDEYELVMTDNGKGLSKDFDFDKSTSLGFQLIKGLSEQLKADLRIVNEQGLKITLSGISAYRTHKVHAMENELKEQMAI